MRRVLAALLVGLAGVAFTNPIDHPDFLSSPDVGTGIMANNVVATLLPGTGIYNAELGYVGSAGGLVAEFFTAGTSQDVTFIWESAPGVALWGQTTTYHGAGSGQVIYDSIPVLGPYLRINSITTSAGVSASLQYSVFASSASPPPPYHALDGTILSVNATAAAGADTNYLPSAQVPGPAFWNLHIAAFSGYVAIDYWNGSAWMGMYYLVDTPAALATLSGAITLPRADIRLRVHNTGGAGVGFQASIVTAR